MKYILLPLFILFFGISDNTEKIGLKNTTEKVDLKVTVTNINAIKGNIKLGIFNKKETFLIEGKEYKSFSKKVTGNKVVFLLKGIEKGTYAITVYHDKNSDNECNMSFWGIPTEAYGFSRNYKPVVSKPSFSDCKIELNENKSIKIKLID